MLMEIDKQKIEDLHSMEPSYEFHWKYDGTYEFGCYNALKDRLDEGGKKVSEVIGCMHRKPLTAKENALLQQEISSKYQMMFNAYAETDFAKITHMVNAKWGDGFNDKGVRFRCSDYIDLNKKEYHIKDIMAVVKGMCDTVLKEYLYEYSCWIQERGIKKDLEKPYGNIYINGICIDVEPNLVKISYMPTETAAYDEDYEIITPTNVIKDED